MKRRSLTHRLLEEAIITSLLEGNAGELALLSTLGALAGYGTSKLISDRLISGGQKTLEDRKQKAKELLKKLRIISAIKELKKAREDEENLKKSLENVNKKVPKYATLVGGLGGLAYGIHKQNKIASLKNLVNYLYDKQKEREEYF